MRVPNLRRSLVLSLACGFLAPAWPYLASAAADEKDKQKAGPTEKVTLQYRVALDAIAPSKFVALIDGGMSVPLELSWDLPQPESPAKREAQQKQKKQFDDMIKTLEEKGINGVEFECSGEWLHKGFRLRLTSVPQPTAAGQRRIKENER
jgi:hypothetical protein